MLLPVQGGVKTLILAHFKVPLSTVAFILKIYFNRLYHTLKIELKILPVVRTGPRICVGLIIPNIQGVTEPDTEVHCH